MKYLKIRNWDRWQTYRADRGQPPWIKLHRRLMRNPEWVSLTDAERGQLVSIWLLAADHDGVIPASIDVIQKLCYMESDLNINKFIELGFICPNDAKVTPTRRQPDQPEAKAETEAETEKSKEEYNEDFLKFYSAYPLKKSKAKAYQSWKKLKPNLKDCLSAIENQKAEKSLLKAENLFCPEWKHPATWLNQKCWEDEVQTTTGTKIIGYPECLYIEAPPGKI